MPGDVQLTAHEVSPAPLDYVVPPSAVIRVKSVRALFTDDGAAGDWLPAVEFISDAGLPGPTASDQGAKVTAGGDAAGSFFPGAAKGAAPVTSGGGVAAIGEMWFSPSISGDPRVTVPTGAALDVPFAHTHTTDGSLIAFTSAVNTNDTLLCKSTSHLYLISASSFWQLSGFVQQTVLQTTGPTVVGGELLGNISNHPAHPADYFNLIQVQAGITQGQVDYMIVKPQAVNQKVTLNALHSSLSDKDITFAFIVCLAFAIG